jgi:hypothetical protein
VLRGERCPSCRACAGKRGPVVAVAGEQRTCGHDDMNDHPVAVELDLVHPVFAGPAQLCLQSRAAGRAPWERRRRAPGISAGAIGPPSTSPARPRVEGLTTGNLRHASTAVDAAVVGLRALTSGSALDQSQLFAGLPGLARLRTSVHVHLQLASVERRSMRSASCLPVTRPDAGIPEHHGAAAVLPFGDRAFERHRTRSDDPRPRPPAASRRASGSVPSAAPSCAARPLPRGADRSDRDLPRACASHSAGLGQSSVAAPAGSAVWSKSRLRRHTRSNHLLRRWS